MHIHRSKRFALLAATTSLLALHAEGVTIRSWLSPVNGSFEGAGNWSGGVVPQPADVVYFNLASSLEYTVNLNTNRTVTSLDVATDNVNLSLGGKTLTLSTAGLNLGINNLSNKATLDVFSGTLLTNQISVGGSLNSNGTFNVSGPSTLVNSSGSISIGELGDGSINVNTGSLMASYCEMGKNAGITGYASLTNGGRWTLSDLVIVGDDGDGVIAVKSQSHFKSLGAVLGDGTGSTGAVTVSGADWVATDAVEVADFGSGTLSITDSGHVTSGSGVLARYGGAGTVLVNNKSEWNNTGSLSIGRMGSGVTTISLNSDVTCGGLQLGTGSNATGRLTLQDGGSSLISTNTAIVGEEGSGTVSISNGAVLLISANDLLAANQPGSAAGITVDGVSSVLSVSGQMKLGTGGPASLSLSNGAAVLCNSAQLGGTSSGRGTLTLSGASTSFSCSNDMIIGGGSFSGGSSVMTVNAGASASIGSSLKIWSPGIVTLGGGSLSVGTINMAGGAFNWNSGTVVLSGAGSTQIGASAPFNLPIDLVTGKTLRGSGTLALATGGVILVDGGNLFAGGLSIASGAELQLNSQSSQASISGQISNTGLISGDGRITGALTNNLGGEVRADAGKHLKFLGNGSSAFNSGKLSMFDGTLEFVAPVINSGSGKILGHGRFVSNTLVNSGTVSLSTGVSDLTGSIVNNNGGKIIITGASQATFYDNVTNNTGSEFRVSSDSSATFLSPVVGLAQFTGVGVKYFEAGASGGALATVVGDSVVDGTSTLAATRIHEDELDVFGVAQVTPNGAAATTSRLNTLLIAGTPNAWTGKLDLSDNALVLDYTGASPLPTVLNQLIAGRANGAWTGNGIASSTAATVAANGSDAHKTALGFAEASSLGITIFGGQTLDPTALLVRYTYLGDANLDGKVNALDFNAVANNFGAASSKLWYEGDFNYDGTVNTSDFTALAINFNQALPTPGLGSLVPEPQILAFVAAFLLPRVKRSKRED